MNIKNATVTLPMEEWEKLQKRIESLECKEEVLNKIAGECRCITSGTTAPSDMDDYYKGQHILATNLYTTFTQGVR